MRPGSARRVPKGAPGRNTERPGPPASAPRERNSCQVASGSENIEFFFARRVHEASVDRCSIAFCQFSRFWQSLRTLQSTAPVSKIKGSATCATSHVARAMLPRKTTKIDPKINPKSSKIASRGRSGDLFGRLWSLEAARSSDSERLGATRVTRRATRSDQVSRSWSVEVSRPARSRGEARVLWR